TTLFRSACAGLRTIGKTVGAGLLVAHGAGRVAGGAAGDADLRVRFRTRYRITEADVAARIDRDAAHPARVVIRRHDAFVDNALGKAGRHGRRRLVVAKPEFDPAHAADRGPVLSGRGLHDVVDDQRHAHRRIGRERARG